MTEEDEALFRLALDAGVLPSEMKYDEEHGVLLSASAVRKLAARAPDRERAKIVLDQVADSVRAGFKCIEGGRT